MYYLLLGIGVAIFGILPLLLRAKIGEAAITGIIFSVVNFILIYLFTPGLIGPLLGWYGFIAVIESIIGYLIAGISGGEDDWFSPLAWIVPALSIVITVVVVLAGTSMFQADAYAHMMPEIQTKEWTQEVQPKDPKHMRMASKENAIQLARNSVGQLGTIGSQFSISEEYTTLQTVNGQLWWVVPLDFTGFFKWNNNGKVPAYIMVDAEDPHRDPKVVQLDEARKMIYTPGAYMSYNLGRHLRANGYIDKGLMDWSFEVDDNLKEWWVVSVYHLEIAGNAERIDGVAVVDPTNGQINYYPIGQVPDWIDRVIPDEIVKEYLDWQGTYSDGWWNAVTSKKNLTEAESPKMIYGANAQPEWVTSITSKSTSDTSLVAVIYTNSRTGEWTRYHVSGGGTDKAILEYVDHNSEVSFKKLKGSDPQIYNIYGHMAAVVPLLNEKHAFQEVAIVDVLNPQIIAVAPDQMDAVRKYQTALAQSGRQTAIDNTTAMQKTTGIVDRINSIVTDGKVIYYIHLKGVPHLFSCSEEASHKVVITTPGDTVSIEYIASQEDVMPLTAFDNLNVPLSKTDDQQTVQNTEVTKTDEEITKRDAKSARDRINNMSDKDLQELIKKAQQNPPKK